ncbi:hypothetical protein [Acinetobacter baumannii]|uniref:hypothetical protein n=1 Tax=Acinetobacter baumannii TaxID=470 RepID=UPI00406C464A
MQLKSTINLKSMYCSLSAIFIFLLSTGFIIYHSFLNESLIPPFLGGFFGPVAALSFIFFLPTFIRVINDSVKANAFLFLIGISSLIIAFIVTATNSINGITEVHLQSYELIFYWITMYVLGFYFLQSDKRKILKYNTIFLTIYTIYAIYFLISEGRVMLNFGLSEEETASNYQSIARSFLIIALIVISYAKKISHEILFSAVSFFLLFIVGARSEFYAFIILLLLYHSIFTFKKKSSLVILTLSIAVVSAIFIKYFDVISQSRQFQVLDLGTTGSWNVRETFKEYALLQISQNPFWGSFGSHASLGTVGAYSHNVLSGYVNYGLFFFLSYLLFFSWAAFYSTVKMFENPNDKDWKFCSLTLIIMLFLVLTAKPVFWPVLYLSFGIFMSKLLLYKKSR